MQQNNYQKKGFFHTTKVQLNLRIKQFRINPAYDK